jgi:hypothetical protein
MINSNKLSLFPDRESKGLSDVSLEESSANCGCNNLNIVPKSAATRKGGSNRPWGRPIHQTAQIYGYSCYNTSGDYITGGSIDSDSAEQAQNTLNEATAGTDLRCMINNI